MKNLTNTILDSATLSAGYTLRNGFPFTCITSPSNIYDAIIIKPYGAECFSPRFPIFQHSLEDYVSFINKNSLEKAMIIANDITFLKQCPSLKYLTIVPADASNSFDFSPVYELPCLLYLRCQTEYGKNFQKQAYIDYSNTNEIVFLDANGKGHLNVNCLKTLRTLSIGENPEKSLHKLLGSSELETLQITNCSLKSLDGIERSKKIQHLELFYNRFLEDISALELIKPTLKSLVIKNCSKIKDFSVLERLEQLEVLALYGNNTLTNLNFLKELSNLKSFGFDVNVLDGNLTPCLSLERVFCAKNRKHYNLKNSALPKGNIFAADISFKGIEVWRKF